ncbi:Hypp6015 [Branchiostoma lanceolatum]|uniref:Coiled-coil domain-containing protein 167 n=1 Tax=Branchiostoma lanceolatum TaxID=7740 RepID=A0A8J9W5D6_BRALA|nr:Hypp6015 [Branchiostoma lanceolatum]
MPPRITEQIEIVESRLQRSRERLDQLERALRLEFMTDKERKNLEDEEETLRKTISLDENNLSTLRSENRRTMLMSVMILVLLYIAYSIFAPS